MKKNRGLFVASSIARPRIDYMFRDEAGVVKTRSKEWRRAATVEAIGEWMENYYGMVADGYLPEGFTVAPMPFCARVIRGSRVLAEWKPRMTAVNAL